MTDNRTPLPADIEMLFYKLEHRVLQLTSTWSIFLEMSTKQDNLDLLNDFEPVLFSHYQSLLQDEIILSICRLLEPPGGRRNRNLVLETLITQLEDGQHCSAETGQALRDRLGTIRESAKPLKHLRNKRLAHIDLDAELQSNHSFLPGVTIAVVQDIIDGILDIRATAFECLVPDVTHDRGAPSLAWHVTQLVRALADAKTYRELRRQERQALGGTPSSSSTHSPGRQA